MKAESKVLQYNISNQETLGNSAIYSQPRTPKFGEVGRSDPFSMASAKKITVKLLVDKERSRVVYAEADKDFLDILFSFLTLPLSTIVKILNKQSTLGCMDNLYESVEKLDIQYLQTEACKTMLLHPRSEAAVQCEDLKINIDDTKPRAVYACKKDDCCSKQTCLVSFAQNAQCIHCKEKMDRVLTWPKNDVKLFVKEGVKYIISDDLRVEPTTVMHILTLLQKMDIKDISVLEERYMDISEEEILALLKRLLVSEMPVTDLYFHHNDKTHDAPRDHVGKKEAVQVKTESNQETNTEGISIKLLINKHTNKILCAEADDDFLNILFSFLTLPLGSLIKILNKNTGTGRVDNLYRSVEDLSLEYIESEQSRSILLSPKLGRFFGCSNNILKLDEINPRESTRNGCCTCYWKNNNKACTAAKCDHGVGESLIKELNPKSPQGGTEKGGGYAKGPGNFVVTDDLHVSPLSISSVIPIVSKLGSSFDSVVERKVVAGEIQVLNLLRAAITSKTPLTDVFSPCQNSRNWSRYSLD
ncbi:uncharacterized protein M6B38_131620 [Iris pallida]|uniref:Uncharacterized protein n=1 Tax=Iris pallida TaxID=29817 RepID=A0AAX6FRV4_IRIPA|nr:uncharacterized protein M6B38_131620 [Iris pallida]